MTKKIAVFTGTRAEYGLLYWLMQDIKDDNALELQVLVSGMHLSPEFGLTWHQIEEDGFKIDEKVEILLSSDSAVGVVKSIGLGLIGFADALTRMKPDLIIILGDRYEAFAAAQAAMFLKIPIFHLHGGEITEGAYDDAIRHAITKLSYLHGVSTEEYRTRVIQLGEEPNRVYNVGALGLEHLHRTKLLSLDALSKSLKFSLDRPYFLVTYHPVTLANESPKRSFEALLDALDEFKDHKVIITYPNSDDGGRQIIPILEKYAKTQVERVYAIPSLGQLRYLSALKYSSMVIGNSSSGIIEAPSFCVPTINIGSRQNGRLAANSVINCQPNKYDIVEAIKTAVQMKDEFNSLKIDNPYGEGDSSKKIINAIKALDFQPMKKFHDLG
ncbi:UDP-N-acetylglucosamine 2-epimerase [Enterobacter ludwigii]|mgnify:CR=1 FL=1|jgi:UDP-N-acetylglucosamine 2-epimerase (non-hydrolysing)|nr:MULTISPECIES: UDP-N-acetylglucosamine 2-epimerase [Enterobacter]EKS6744931.1 UDP-N-acetylglucosamine 2-epimerase (hydrolyzing) [Enterobacter ludwigii]EKS7113414.1 UDP-N-acetylglucosamine 2-epimerase (hydrolyzing) [Enterobacter ludwigii]ELK6309915.1 UDP-N-acetylglucosamine 2-epimerase (hydrolyzing) [Enterobacter ludwigii]ELP5691824.1 UDP-N-acetylglucosamine 2-epimerase (hydrolyzing) [Enterobacter ludwigii]ELQ7822497.1 UDP-N-acetylglucosamine 2-epimerase (hydrolyzing) [Enterobacter ludwigii]